MKTEHHHRAHYKSQQAVRPAVQPLPIVNPWNTTPPLTQFSAAPNTSKDPWKDSSTDSTEDFISKYGTKIAGTGLALLFPELAAAYAVGSSLFS